MIKARWFVCGLVAAGLAVAIGAAPASAGPPGRWTQVTAEAQSSNTGTVGVERTADGTLHVLWARDSGPTEELVHTSIAPDAATVSDPHVLISTPHSVNRNADLIAGPSGGIRAIFAGLFPGAPAFSDGVATATSTNGGVTWSPIAPASENDPTIQSDGEAYIAAGLSGGVGLDGTVISIWGDSSAPAAAYHVGLNPLVPDIPLSPALCEGDPNVAVDSVSGDLVLGWNCIQTDTMQVMRLGGGGVENVPRSGASSIGQRAGLSGRLGADGVYAAFGTGSNAFDARPALWRVGSANPKVIKQPRDATDITLAPAPGGRLWIAWVGDDRGERIFATRTNAAATKFGEVVSVRPPNGTQDADALAVEGSRGFLDVVAQIDRGGNDIAFWHQRMLPGLTLKAKPAKLAAGKKAKFRVTDAGAGVAGAKVTLKLGKNKVSAKSKPNGRVALKVPAKTKPKRYAATARKAGYAPGKTRVRVR